MCDIKIKDTVEHQAELRKRLGLDDNLATK